MARLNLCAHGGIPLERLATEYWRAAKSLRGSCETPLSPGTAARYLLSLARTCPHERLRSAAGGTLISIGLFDLSHEGAPGPEAA